MSVVWAMQTEDGRIHELTRDQMDALMSRDPGALKPGAIVDPSSSIREWFRQNLDTELVLVPGDHVVVVESTYDGTAYRDEAIFLGVDAQGTHTFQTTSTYEIISLHWEQDVVDGNWFVRHV